jgi:hypothetical protein
MASPRQIDKGVGVQARQKSKATQPEEKYGLPGPLHLQRG